MDIMYIPLTKDFVYLACVIDINSRKILSSVISKTLLVSFYVQAYTEAVRLYGAPEIFNIDQGSQFSSDAFVASAAASGARLSMDKKWGLNRQHFQRALLVLTEVRRGPYEGLLRGSGWRAVNLQIHREIQHDQPTGIPTRQKTKQDVLISTSRGTPKGNTGRPAISRIFEQNPSH
jgi:hypothetical protein